MSHPPPTIEAVSDLQARQPPRGDDPDPVYRTIVQAELDDHDAADLDDGEPGEWLEGLRAVGLPVRTPREPSAATRVLVERSWAPATLAAYESAWANFAAWCWATRRVEALEATEVDVADYLAYHVQAGLSAAYMSRNLAGITHGFEITGQPSPTRHPLVTRTLAGARRQVGTAPKQAAPIRLDELRKLVAGLAIVSNRPPNHPIVRRDRALLLLGWAAALRASELVGLDVEDLTFTGDADRGTGGLLIKLNRSKTDQEARGRSIAVPYSTHIGSCPARATQLLARERRTGPLFRHIDRHGHLKGRLSPDAVSTIVQRHIIDVLGDDPGLYSGHSLRAGFVTEMRARGIPPHLIMRQTGHRDARMLTTYDRPTDLFNEPPLAGEWW